MDTTTDYNEQFNRLFTQHFTTEQANMFKNIIVLLDKALSTGYQDKLLNFISVSDIMDVGEYPNIIYEIFIEELMNTLKANGFIINEELPISYKTLAILYRILNSYVNIVVNVSDNIKDIEAVLSEGTTDYDIIINLINLDSNISKNTLEDVIVILEPKVIEGIKRLVILNNELETVIEAVNVKTDKIEKLLKLDKDIIPLGAILLTEHPDLDTSASFLYKHYLEDVTSHKDAKAAAIHELSLAVISDDIDDNSNFLDFDSKYKTYFYPMTTGRANERDIHRYYEQYATKYLSLGDTQ